MATRSTPVTIEAGAKRTFASALDWPGWCRCGRDEVGALDALEGSLDRYGQIVARSRWPGPPAPARWAVVERVDGDAGTDFGAPSVVTTSDHAALTAEEAGRRVDILEAAWAALETVVAETATALRRGPRGGGRDRDAIALHVVEAERAYARRVGVRLTAAEWRDDGVPLLRARLTEVLRRPSDASSVDPPSWPPRYAVRRIAWHVLDHAWEIEDRR